MTLKNFWEEINGVELEGGYSVKVENITFGSGANVVILDKDDKEVYTESFDSVDQCCSVINTLDRDEYEHIAAFEEWLQGFFCDADDGENVEGLNGIFVTTNGYDAILIDDPFYGIVRMFDVDPATLKDYLASGGDFENWYTVEEFTGKLSELDVVAYWKGSKLVVAPEFEERKRFHLGEYYDLKKR